MAVATCAATDAREAAMRITRQPFAKEEALFGLAERCLDARALESLGRRSRERSQPVPV